MTTSEYTLSQLRSRFTGMTSRVIAHCELSTEIVGGMQADRAGVEAFVSHHLHLTGQDAADAVSRILKEEIGERDVPSETGELKEKLSYGINVLRRDPTHGPWIKDHMVKACLKASASRLGLFMQKRGSKGDMSEMGEARAYGCSLLQPEFPQRIYLRDKSGTGPARTYFQNFKGRVQTPQGSKSIDSDCECAAPGSRFEFEFRYMPGKIKRDDIVDIFSCAMVIGLGSAKALECGKFSIVKLEYEEAAVGRKEGKGGKEDET